MRYSKNILITTAVIFAFASCVKDKIHETEHPETAKIIELITDWSACNEQPADYTVRIGSYSGSFSAQTNGIDHLFDPGDYDVHICNTAQNISVHGTTVTADYASATRLGWLYTGLREITMEADKDYSFTVAMRQQVRQLTLTVKPEGGSTDRIASITASLSGVASTLDFATDEHGGATDVPLTFVRDRDGNWTATIRLLGITGTEQRLTGTIRFLAGSPADLPLESDLSTELGAFNSDKNIPFALGGDVEVPDEAGFTATINGWQVITDSGTAE